VNSDSYKCASAEGRVPPPEEYRIPKGKSGNYKGRPRGSVSRSKLIRKVANTTHRVGIDGISQRRTLLELLILKIQAMALNGNAGAASLMNDLFGLAIPPEPPEGCGFLLVPAPVSLEELMADEEARNAGALEPGTFVNIKAEEFSKAARGEPSPLGEALLAFHRKYSALGS
jgi:Family of unknown function (DUF5681)